VLRTYATLAEAEMAAEELCDAGFPAFALKPDEAAGYAPLTCATVVLEHDDVLDDPELKREIIRILDGDGPLESADEDAIASMDLNEFDRVQIPPRERFQWTQTTTRNVLVAFVVLAALYAAYVISNQ